MVPRRALWPSNNAGWMASRSKWMVVVVLLAADAREAEADEVVAEAVAEAKVAESSHNLLALALTQQAVIHEDSRQLITHGPVYQRSGNR